ncbi:hypothetical protein O0I10_011458 [Lichtheimia ornata]|uniref:Uncharacterized protein n=1 Tax=Lichtheimia ornata TaxID=688661 RepID=A0AAD7XQH3_9FUNG|nr:uncharacterized protein O0I10_011458 [Lichtheimia ornata]KAJ8652924.1 hypothetical protein O0I10_011458 [Lichtheimia ornata]
MAQMDHWKQHTFIAKAYTMLSLPSLVILQHATCNLLGSGLFGYPMVDIVVGYSRELLVIWCLVEVYKVTAMIVESCQPWGRVFISFGGGNLSCISGGWLLYQTTGDFSEDCQPLHVSYEWTVSATRNSIHIVGVISNFIPSSGASGYR